MSFSNVYHQRRVAESASKPCFICYKSTPTVLNQEDGKDWFYVCPGHLTDRGFAQPVVSKEEEEAKRKKEELDKEIEKVKQEYEEKQKKKKKDKSKKDKDKDDNDDSKSKDEDEKEKDEKIKSIEEKADSAASASAAGPRVFILDKRIYQMRLNRLKNAQQMQAQAKQRQQEAKQAQETSMHIQDRLSKMGDFPSVPTKDP